MPDLPEWLREAVSSDDLSGSIIAVRLAIAALCGVCVAAVFVGSHRRIAGTFTLLTTLVLLTILVAMTTVVIGSNIARAFGLVGALSIVRFRTVVEDTRDTAFVIFAVVVGMAVGAGYFLVCLIGIPTVAVVAIAMSQLSLLLGGSGVEHRLEVRMGVQLDPDAKLSGVFEEQLLGWRLLSAGSAKQGTALDLAYSVRLREAAGELALVRAIQTIDGVVSVEIKEC